MHHGKKLLLLLCLTPSLGAYHWLWMRFGWDCLSRRQKRICMSVVAATAAVYVGCKIIKWNAQRKIEDNQAALQNIDAEYQRRAVEAQRITQDELTLKQDPRTGHVSGVLNPHLANIVAEYAGFAEDAPEQARAAQAQTQQAINEQQQKKQKAERVERVIEVAARTLATAAERALDANITPAQQAANRAERRRNLNAIGGALNSAGQWVGDKGRRFRAWRRS